MKQFKKFVSIVLIVTTFLLIFVSCNNENGTKKNTPTSENTEFEYKDYVDELKLDMDTTTKKSKATVYNYVDGDTTHFVLEDKSFDESVLKARYLAINTPESTGQIQEWGKKASKFTKETLKKATSIIVESDDDEWNMDSTGGRYLVWIWYRTSEESDYRNLNLEILQNGLAIASNISGNRYGDICYSALEQAKKMKLNVFSGEKDPDFYYGEAQVISLKELRTNIEKYEGTTVAFEAVVTKNYNNSLYVENYDDETGLYYGLYVYLGYGLSGKGLEICSIGNRVMFVGSLQYYETGGTYQLSDIKYQAMRPNDPTNIKLISTGNSASFKELDPGEFANEKVNIEFTDEETEEISNKEFDFAYLALNTSVSMKNLEVTNVYTTDSEESSSKGAMTLICKSGEDTIKVRTVVLMDENNKVITSDAFWGKTIDVKGYVDYFSGEYQIKVFSMNDITIY